jgi:hypothetical protein
MFDFTHPIRQSENPSMRKKKGKKKTKNDKEKEKYTSD